MHPSVSALLAPAQLQLDLHATTEKEAITEVAELLNGDPRVLDFELFRNELFSREKLSPTALGSGVAFPHARTDAVSQIIMAIGRSVPGVAFERCPEPVHLIFVIGTPRESIREYLGILAGLAVLLRQRVVREKLMQAKTAEEFLAVLSAGK